MGTERSWKLEMELFHSPVVYPGHPLVIAFFITHEFKSLEDALYVEPNGQYSAALASNAVPGGGGEVHQALDLLCHIRNGMSPTDAVEYARKRWVDGNAGGHTKAVEPGQAQADQITDVFIERVQEWIKK